MEGSEICTKEPLVNMPEMKWARKKAVTLKPPKSTNSLILAAESGHLDMVRLLIETAADVNAARIDGYTALMCAAQNGHTDCAKLLIEAGATVNASDS